MPRAELMNDLGGGDLRAMNDTVEQPCAIESIPVRPFGLVSYNNGQSGAWLCLRLHAVMTAKVEIVFPVPPLA